MCRPEPKDVVNDEWNAYATASCCDQHYETCTKSQRLLTIRVDGHVEPRVGGES
jgi:hypothetical protein